MVSGLDLNHVNLGESLISTTEEDFNDNKNVLTTC